MAFLLAWLLSVLLDFVIWVFGQERGWFLFSQTVSCQVDTVSIVDDAVEDGVGDGRLADHFEPGCHGELGCYQR